MFFGQVCWLSCKAVWCLGTAKLGFVKLGSSSSKALVYPSLALGTLMPSSGQGEVTPGLPNLPLISLSLSLHEHSPGGGLSCSEQPVSCLEAQGAATLLRLFTWHKTPACARVTFCLQWEPSSHKHHSWQHCLVQLSLLSPVIMCWFLIFIRMGSFVLKTCFGFCCFVFMLGILWWGSCFPYGPRSFTLPVWSVSPHCLVFLRSWSQAEMGGHLLSVSKICKKYSLGIRY